MPAFELIPRKVPVVQTKYRKIISEIAVPESIGILENLRCYEPLSMSGQPPVLWDRADGVQFHDRWGNTWLVNQNLDQKESRNAPSRNRLHVTHVRQPPVRR